MDLKYQYFIYLILYLFFGFYKKGQCNDSGKTDVEVDRSEAKI